MNINKGATAPGARAVLLTAGLTVAIAGCASSLITEGTGPALNGTSPIGTDASGPGSAEGQPADVGTTSGDVPDNAVFLTYRDGTLGFAVQYVEGWQVVPDVDGVTIRDKDSSEIIRIVHGQSDPAAYVADTDLPALQQQAGFALIKQDTVSIGGRSLVHLAYHLPAPTDPVTGKQVRSTVDRYYVPGAGGIAVVSLSTPDGVDNADAFRQMIESFRWA